MFSKDRKFYLRFFSLMIPLVLQNITLFSVSLVDNVMIGRYNELSLSAVAAANQVQFFLQMVTGGAGAGIIVLGSQYWGQGRTGDLRSIVSVGTKILAAIGLFFFLIVFFLSPQLMRLITPDQPVIDEAAAYLAIICFTYIFSCLTSALLAAMQCVETVRIGFVVTLTAIVVNIALNYLLIFGNLGAPRLGLRGAAIATLIARIVEFAIACFYVLAVDKKLQIKLRDFVGRDFSFLGDYLRCGLPVIGSSFLWALGTGFQVAILGRLGAQVLAANGIATTVFQIFSVANGSMSAAATIVIGKAVGEGDREKVKLYARTLQILFLGIGFISGGLLYLCKNAVLSFYIVSPETYALANSFLTILSVTLVGTCYQAPSLTGIVRGGGDTKFVLINDTIFQFFIVVPSAALAAFVFRCSPAVVYMFLKSDQITKCLVAIVKVNRYRWIKTLTR